MLKKAPWIFTAAAGTYPTTERRLTAAMLEASEMSSPVGKEAVLLATWPKC